MKTMTANDLKTKGVACIEACLQQQDEALITVRGKPRYVVMQMAEYDRLRELELDAALQQAKADVAAGRVIVESVAEHMQRVLSQL